ncbi:MAG: DMT family transporter [Acidobacteriota bacterium]
MSKLLTNTYFNKRAMVLALTLGAVMISFSGVWVKLGHVSPTAAAFYRVLFGGVFLFLGSLWRREFRPVTRIQTGLVLFSGLIFSIDLVLFHLSIHYVGPGLGTILPNFQVFIMAAAGSLFLKEKLKATYLLSLPLAVVGLFFIVGTHWGQLGAQYRIGIYAGLGTSFCYSGFLLSLRKLHEDSKTASLFYILMLVSFAAAGFLAIEMRRTGDSFAIPDVQTLLSLLALGIFSQGVGWILISKALPHLHVSFSGLILLLQPALAFVWDVVFFDRQTGWVNWIGVATVLCAIYLGIVGRKSA